jgi:hypothetical protein
MSLMKYEFPWPDDNKGYKLFPEELENDPLVLFQGTSEKNLEPIANDGFKSCPPLESVSYAKSSIYCLSHICSKRSNNTSENDVVIAVKFESLNVPGIVENLSDIHVYKTDIQPEIIGYCIVPHSYKHE